MNVQNIRLREFREEDRPLILSTWWKSLKDPPTFDVHIPDPIYRREKKAVVNKLLDGAVTLVAHELDDEDKILGYICGEASLPVIHYVYVKRIYTGFGIARLLVDTYCNALEDSRVVTISHITHAFTTRFFNQKPNNSRFTYNPYILKELGYDV